MLPVRRAPLLAGLLTVAAMLPALAHATPPDSTWIAGVYDDGDFDDIVVRITSGTGDVPAALPTDLRPLHALVLGLGPVAEPVPAPLAGFPRKPRAPPAR
jgi:hypothetical protein